MRNIIIVAHKFLTQTDDDLILYLNKNKHPNVMHICHSFSDAPDRCSYYTWYKEGLIYKEYKAKDYIARNDIFIYLKEFYFTLKWLMMSQIEWDTYIGMDGLCVFWGNLARSLRRVNKTVYWAIDFVPENRFKSHIKNKIYLWINKRGYKESDEMWDLSPRMAEARKKLLAININYYKFHQVVSYGAWTNRIRKYRYEESDKNTVVFMGHLLEKQGVQLVINAIPEIIKAVPDFRFKIIGGGQYREALIALARHLNVINYCDFKGKIEDHKDLENEIAKSCLAIAPYIKELDTWTYYADPGKVKTYLACGLPVLLTDLPWNAQE
ncbi:glycosyltransferase family 4 protein, partial [Candidatus Microgenomates bacterium]|nr:glycosyltransferase family 4 protein [Candidatus Microgenomates bacterium]